MMMHDVHMKRRRLRCNNQYKCHFKSWAWKMIKLLQASKLFHGALPISNIEVDMSKIDVITSLSYPASMWEVHSFLGHTGFYMRFI